MNLPAGTTTISGQWLQSLLPGSANTGESAQADVAILARASTALPSIARLHAAIALAARSWRFNVAAFVIAPLSVEWLSTCDRMRSVTVSRG